jgi:hypothetical protein
MDFDLFPPDAVPWPTFPNVKLKTNIQSYATSYLAQDRPLSTASLRQRVTATKSTPPAGTKSTSNTSNKKTTALMTTTEMGRGFKTDGATLTLTRAVTLFAEYLMESDDKDNNKNKNDNDGYYDQTKGHRYGMSAMDRRHGAVAFRSIM